MWYCLEKKLFEIFKTMMKLNLKKISSFKVYLCFVSLTLILLSCTPVARFSSIKYDNKSNSIAKNQTTNIKINKDSFKIPSEYRTSDIRSSENIQYMNEDGTYMNQEDFAYLLRTEAESWIGVPYKWGGVDKSGVDCSAFVQNVFANIGFSLPRTAAMQFDFSSKIEDNNRKVGDLIFFRKSDDISHVGIYLGNDEVIHASSSQGVIIQSLNNQFFINQFAGFGRVIPEEVFTAQK